MGPTSNGNSVQNTFLFLFYVGLLTKASNTRLFVHNNNGSENWAWIQCGQVGSNSQLPIETAVAEGIVMAQGQHTGD